MPRSAVKSEISAGKVSQASKVSKKSYVDEALFGSKKDKNGATAANIVSKEELRQIRDKTEKGQKSDAVVITHSDLQRMKESTKIQSKEQEIQSRRLLEEQKDQQMAAAKARKKKMQEMDQERQNKVPPTEYQQHTHEQNQTLLTKAMEMLDEEHDDVKHMNQMMLYSKVVTIRDKQKEEQKVLESEWINEQKRLDVMMEIERLKALKMQEEREVQKKIAQKQGSLVIIDQIKEREMERIKEQEIREKEMMQMQRQIEILKEEEVRVAQEKQERAKVMMSEVEDANKRAIGIKENKKQEEKNLEYKIVEYNKAKAQREEEKLAEDKRIKDEKEREVQRLRDLQEKAQDRQSEIDALRAKRAFEESERVARDKERKELEWRQKVLVEMEDARQTQFNEKERRLAEQAKQERDEFMRIIQKQREFEEQEKRIEEEKKTVLKGHSHQLRGQISNNEDKKKQDRLDYLEEGRKIRQKIDEERKKIEAIKAKKIGELKNLDIPDKYQAELAKKKISF